MLGRKLSRCRSDGCLRPTFSYHDRAYTWAASCSGPRTISGHHGAVRYDPPRLPLCNTPVSCMLYTAGGSGGRLCLLSASGFRTHAWQRVSPPLGGAACASRRSVYRVQSILGIPDGHKVLLVYMALLLFLSLDQNFTAYSCLICAYHVDISHIICYTFLIEGGAING